MFCQDLQNQTACSSQSNEPLIHKIEQKVEFGSLSAVVNDTADPDQLSSYLFFIEKICSDPLNTGTGFDCSGRRSDKTKAHDPGEN